MGASSSEITSARDALRFSASGVKSLRVFSYSTLPFLKFSAVIPLSVNSIQYFFDCA